MESIGGGLFSVEYLNISRFRKWRAPIGRTKDVSDPFGCLISSIILPNNWRRWSLVGCWWPAEREPGFSCLWFWFAPGNEAQKWGEKWQNGGGIFSNNLVVNYGKFIVKRIVIPSIYNLPLATFFWFSVKLTANNKIVMAFVPSPPLPINSMPQFKMVPINWLSIIPVHNPISPNSFVVFVPLKEMEKVEFLEGMLSRKRRGQKFIHGML